MFANLKDELIGSDRRFYLVDFVDYLDLALNMIQAGIPFLRGL
jgi:hypothetical protein